MYPCHELVDAVRTSQHKTMSMAANLADHVQDNGEARTAYQKFMQEMATNQRTVEDLCQQFQRRQALLMSQTTNARDKNRQVPETDRSKQAQECFVAPQRMMYTSAGYGW